MSLLEADRTAPVGLSRPRPRVAALVLMSVEVVAVIGCIVLIVALVWDNRHYPRVWVDDERDHEED